MRSQPPFRLHCIPVKLTSLNHALHTLPPPRRSTQTLQRCASTTFTFGLATFLLSPRLTGAIEFASPALIHSQQWCVLTPPIRAQRSYLRSTLWLCGCRLTDPTSSDLRSQHKFRLRSCSRAMHSLLSSRSNSGRVGAVPAGVDSRSCGKHITTRSRSSRRGIFEASKSARR